MKKKKTKPLTLTKSFNLLLVAIFLAVISFLGGIKYRDYQIAKQQVPEFPEKAMVSRVIDGDTIELATGQPFRLYGISCPDQGKPFYDQAIEFTKDLVLDKQVILEYEENYKSDKFGRLLGYVTTDDKNLNVELVRQGLCQVVIYEKRAKLIYQDELLAAQEEAKTEKLGIWSK